MHSLSPQCAAACKAVLFSSSWILNIIAVAVLTSWHKQCLKSVWNYLYDTCTSKWWRQNWYCLECNWFYILREQKKKRDTTWCSRNYKTKDPRLHCGSYIIMKQTLLPAGSTLWKQQFQTKDKIPSRLVRKNRKVAFCIQTSSKILTSFNKPK